QRYPIKVQDRIYGTVIIEGAEPLEAFENSVLLSILGECALTLENSRNTKEKEAAKLQAENEKLRANLLRSISHDLRTPLTSISGNAGMLLSDLEKLDNDTIRQMCGDIYDDSAWLTNLVENLLAVTKIEEGRMRLQKQPHLVEEIVTEALQHITRKQTEHTVTVHHENELLLARCDARLIIQVIINLVDNAIKYTPAGSHITITTKQNEQHTEISVADNGAGILDNEKEKVFQMFYSGSNPIADCRRSLGIGLNLCKSIITAHGGEITVSDNTPTGTIFTFTIPSGEVEFHE
ncbi:MAG: ATP-binding protein, partial [Oscillospiraceae bacterium]|nr:ATP-binding protein [Oscillospiraceae bacterium]